MRLRLELLNEDVVDRFDISPTESSFIFKFIYKIIEQIAKYFSCLVASRSYTRIHLLESMPGAFIKTGNNKCRVLLDCAEDFIERSKSLDCQASTWSDYKHHDNIKFQFGSSLFGVRKKYTL